MCGVKNISSLILFFFTLNSVKCSVKSRQKCFEYKYKPYENRNKLLSLLEDQHKIGHLSLTGTHDSMVYEAENPAIKTQELGVGRQLRIGVRVIDISLNIKMKNSLDSSVNDDMLFEIARTNRSLDYLLGKISNFLMKNPLEFVVVYISDLEDGFDDNFWVKLDLCQVLKKYKTEENGGDRWAENWDLNDTIGMHRGKILFASNLFSFDKCAFVLKDNCVFLRKHPLAEENEALMPRRIQLEIDYLWYKHLVMLSSDEYRGARCYVNVFHQSSKIFPRGIARDGGWIFDCFEPINHRLAQHFPGTQQNALNILIVDFVTQEIVNQNNLVNEIHHCSRD